MQDERSEQGEQSGQMKLVRQADRDPLFLPPASGRAGLLAVVAAGALFMLALSAVCWWAATLPAKAANRAGRALEVAEPVTHASPAGSAAQPGSDAPGAPASRPAGASHGVPADAARHESPASRPDQSSALPDPLPLPPGPVDEQPGLALTFTRPDGKTASAGGVAGDTRTARLVSLYVPIGEPPTPFMTAGPFVATWEGDLNLRLRDSYAFTAQGRGTLDVTVNGQTALKVTGDFSSAVGERAALKKGKNHVVVRYESPTNGDSMVRLLWAGRGERLPQPPAPQSWTHDAGATSIRLGRRLRQGRFLLAEMRCTKCHAVPQAGTPAVDSVSPADTANVGPMPELAMDAPSLTDVGARLNGAWVAAWVTNPKALRPDAHMPKVFHGNGKHDTNDLPANGGGAAGAAANCPVTIDPRAADAAAYLSSLARPVPAPAAGASDEQIRAGGALFAELRCVACHATPDAAMAGHVLAAESEGARDLQAEIADAGNGGVGIGGADDSLAARRVSLRYVRAKFTSAGLRQYLLDPHAGYRWNPMPGFGLTGEEADALAAYLLATTSGKVPAIGAVPIGDAGRGKALIGSAGCLNCHALGAERSTARAPALADLAPAGWTKGLRKGERFHTAGPRYELTDDERAALVAFTATDRSSLSRTSAPEFAERQVLAMRCTACHARDGRESLLATALDREQKELEARFPQTSPVEGEAGHPDTRAPLLTWAGEKLQPDWMATFIAGRLDYKPRPYLRARMPAFPARAALIAAGLAEEHGCAPAAPSSLDPDADMALIGQTLAGRTPNKSFACVQCHAVADTPAFSPGDAPAVNFMYARERLRKDYYDRWVHNPLSVDPDTKMPAFERDDATTAITSIYDGDARKQFEAIWQYLRAGRHIKPPID